MYEVFTEVANPVLTGEKVQRHQFEDRRTADRWAEFNRSQSGVVNVWVEENGRVVDGVVSVRFVVLSSDGNETFRNEFDTAEAAAQYAETIWDGAESCKLVTEPLV